MKYRDAQGKGSMKYWFANIVEDYMDATQGNPRKNSAVLDDYQRFLADRSVLVSAADAMKSSETAMTADDFNTSWIEFIQARG